LVGHWSDGPETRRCPDCHALYALVGVAHRCLPAEPPPPAAPRWRPSPGGLGADRGLSTR